MTEFRTKRKPVKFLENALFVGMELLKVRKALDVATGKMAVNLSFGKMINF
jgi:hypothetical protein